jgi:hypothetical protein
MLSKIHLPSLLPYPLHMTGVVEEVADPGAIAMVEAVDGGCVLGDIPGYSSLFLRLDYYWKSIA